MDTKISFSREHVHCTGVQESGFYRLLICVFLRRTLCDVDSLSQNKTGNVRVTEY
jgi:hypothetical protein